MIVAFHRPRELEALLRLLIDPAIEVIVVNVEGDPRIEQLGAEMEVDAVITTRLNVGYAAAVNLGVSLAKGQAIVFMNDDVVATARDVRRLAARVQRGYTDVAIPLVAGDNGELQLGKRLPLHLAGTMLLKGMSVPNEPFAVDAAWAPMVAVRSDVLRAIPVPEAYFLYWEEFEWFFRLRRRGVRVETNPGVRVRHLSSPADARADKSRLLARNAVRCVRRTLGRRAALRAWPVVVLWQLQLLLRSAVRGPDGSPRAHAAGVRAALGAWREV